MRSSSSAQSRVLNLQPFRAYAHGTYSGVWWDPTQPGQGISLSQDGKDLFWWVIGSTTESTAIKNACNPILE